MDATGEVVNLWHRRAWVYTYATESVRFAPFSPNPPAHWELEAAPLPFSIRFR